MNVQEMNDRVCSDILREVFRVELCALQTSATYQGRVCQKLKGSQLPLNLTLNDLDSVM